MSEVTLNAKAVLATSLVIPAAGVWHADVEVANGEALADAIGKPLKASLTCSDVTFTGTILPRGGPYDGHGWFRVVGGTNGWGKPVDAKPYRSAAGVKASTVLGDVARDAGEQLGPFTDFRVGGWYVRPSSTARDALEDVTKGAWYVDETGTTQLGARAKKAWNTSHRLLDSRPDRNWVRIAADSLKGLVPGAQLEGLTAATVRHELSGEKLHTTIFGTDGAVPGDRFLQRFVAIVRAIMRPTFFHGLYEFRVRGGSGGYLDLDPSKKSLGLPPLNNVPVRVGVYGARGTPTNGTSVYVGFVNGDPSIPFVDGFAGEWEGASSIPSESSIFANVVKLGDGSAQAIAFATGVSDLQNDLNTWSPSSADGAAVKALLTAWLANVYATTKVKAA